MVRFPRWLTGVLIGLIVLGIVFRFVNLNHKVYWHDEVYTSLRASGYTRGEIDQALFQNHALPIGALQQYQQIKPGSTAMDTVRSLALEDPQHPPLYFLLTRGWMQAVGAPLTYLFKSPLSVTRSLPALLSLLALPAMYGLAWELFACPAVALLATTLMALSPYDVLFAQTARQYSFLTVMVIASSFLLLRAIRLFQTAASQSANAQRHAMRHPKTWLNWGLYALAIAIGLYTHPFFGLTIASHVVYVVGCLVWEPRLRKQSAAMLKLFGSAIALAVLSFSPWLVVMLVNWRRAVATTDWTQVVPGLTYFLKLWGLSFSSLFVDLDFGFDNPLTYLIRLPFLLLTGIALYTLCRRTALPTWLFVVTSIAVPFLLLALPDLILGGKRSAVSRYLVSCYPGVQLAVAYFLAHQLAIKRVYSGRSRVLTNTHTSYTLRPTPHAFWQTWFWRGVLAVLVLASVTSLTMSALADSWWNKDLSYSNHQTADLLNKIPAPMVISDIGDDYTNTGDLISLSYRLRADIPLLLLQDSGFVTSQEFQTKIQGKTAIAFRPTQSLQQVLAQRYGKLTQILAVERLWEIPPAQLKKIDKNKSIKKKD
ncbi:MAG: glycosyl transferase family 39 [Leptolyngbyaceae cyanobacterium bins.349]|nr:glycosyl transferase family 39 [Leptolyngbyaceae cyanobacterium bins.349]